MNAATIKFARNLLDMSQLKFSELLDVHKMTVMRWETGAYSPGEESAKKIRAALGDEALEKLEGFVHEQELKALKESVKSQLSIRTKDKKGEI